MGGGLPDALWVRAGVAEPLVPKDAVDDAEAVSEGDLLEEGVRLALTVFPKEGVGVGLRLGGAVAVALGEDEPLSVPVGVRESVEVGDVEGKKPGAILFVGENVRLLVRARVPLGLGVGRA